MDIQFNPVKPISPGGELGGELEISVHGLWSEAIMWEVPLMSALSQAYYETIDLDWSNEGQEGWFGYRITCEYATHNVTENAYNKGKRLLENDAIFSEFGTRRRRAFSSHDLVMQGLKRASNELEGKTKGKLNGTSNASFSQPGTSTRVLTDCLKVFLAYKHGLMPIGTIAQSAVSCLLTQAMI